MNNQIGNRDKRVAVLLIAAFAWLFIGSLIIFHEEHVLGKHFALTSQIFISPKSNDKKDYSPDLHKPVNKVPVSFEFDGLPVGFEFSDIPLISYEFKLKSTSTAQPGDVFLNDSPLRAPPVL